MNDSGHDADFKALLKHIRQSRGVDFTGYKHSSLMRRVCKRMQAVNISTFKDYRDYLEVAPEEFIRLFNTILINVTAFFRDQPAWDYLKEVVIPPLLANKPPEDPVRAWSVGCASGEEAYSLAMLLAETLGHEAFRKRVKIYATDIDDEALNEARRASYSAKAVESVPKPWRERYFEWVGERYVFRNDLRRAVIFGHHDMTQDAPISNLDIVVCRNTLMYLNAETQRRILERFHFALNNEGILFLGKAEMLLTHNGLFNAVELSHRLFRKVSQTDLRYPIFSPPGRAMEPSHKQREETQLRQWALAFEKSPTAQILVDAKGTLTAANAQARSLFNLNSKDVSRPFQDLELSYRPVELRSCIDQAYLEERAIILSDVRRNLPDNEFQCLEIQVIPLTDPNADNRQLGVYIVFNDVTAYQRLRQDLERANQELETTNEELQSTNEELETTNEELQSTNEELETMNEELQSTNEELEAFNEQLRQRTEEANKSNAFLNAILGSLHSAVIVLDDQDKILAWNPKAEDLWGPRADEVLGHPFLGLDIGLPVKRLKPYLRRTLDGDGNGEIIAMDAINRRGQPICCRITVSVLNDVWKRGCWGVILLMEEAYAERH